MALATSILCRLETFKESYVQASQGCLFDFAVFLRMRISYWPAPAPHRLRKSKPLKLEALKFMTA